MAKEFVKGVTVGEATAEENTQPAVSTVETNEEETKQVIRANEEDFIAGLIAAADFASDEEETQRIEIIRNGKLAFAFSVRPLGSEEYDKCRKKFTKYVRNKQLGGQSGSLYSRPHFPIMLRAAFIGIGFTSLKITSIKGLRATCSRPASVTFPSRKSCIIRL